MSDDHSEDPTRLLPGMFVDLKRQDCLEIFAFGLDFIVFCNSVSSAKSNQRDLVKALYDES